MHQLNQQFHEFSKRLKAEKKKEKTVQNMSTNNYGLLSCRFDAYVNQLDLQHLEQLKRSMVEFKKNVAQRVDELNLAVSSKHAQEEEQVENTEINDNDVSTIPHDWLRSMVELKKNMVPRVDELNSEGSSKHAQEEEQVENTEINDNDVSTIPHDWLRL
ncbi:hypothetical protein LOK49_LG09G00830 [Camellia lanceoleosa]|uniref:Uncharacterized protein n=1 Tax=Camellia lanceoleosa TaxID=1840588 RepID=A0ACC0GH55_9ERIC|nr:hypothetical protein LOK49_LG09G00830 [Camellia lanceoleosa]